MEVGAPAVHDGVHVRDARGGALPVRGGVGDGEPADAFGPGLWSVSVERAGQGEEGKRGLRLSRFCMGLGSGGGTGLERDGMG